MRKDLKGSLHRLTEVAYFRKLPGMNEQNQENKTPGHLEIWVSTHFSRPKEI